MNRLASSCDSGERQPWKSALSESECERASSGASAAVSRSITTPGRKVGSTPTCPACHVGDGRDERTGTGSQFASTTAWWYPSRASWTNPASSLTQANGGSRDPATLL